MDINVTSYCDRFLLNIGNFYENFSYSEEINYPETSHCNEGSDYGIKISATVFFVFHIFTIQIR